MKIDELKELLPFFAAGTLEPDEMKKVEEALKTSEELRRELQFWEHAKAAVTLQASYDAEGHLSAEKIVSYAEGTLRGDERTVAERHLQSCTTCTEGYRLVKKTLPIRKPVAMTVLGRITAFVKSVRPAYAFPVLAVLVATVLIIVYQSSRRPEVTQRLEPSGRLEVPVKPPMPGPVQPEGKSLAVILTYQPTLRSAGETKFPRVVLKRNTDKVVFTLALPHTFKGGSYQVTLMSPGSITTGCGVLTPFANGPSRDSLLVQLERGLLENDGVYTFTAQEVLPQAATEQGLTPEPPYVIRFVLKREP